MKKLLLETNLSKVYMVGVILISLILVGVYFSYAMFTVSKEKNQAISIITGNLTYDLKVDGTTSNELVVANGETKTFTVTLTNPNNRTARFNFYYVGDLADGLTAGYVVEEGVNTPPEATGVNLETSGAGSSQTYTIKVTNDSGSSKTITLGVEVGLDYNDLTLPSNGHLFEKALNPTVAEVLLAGVGDRGSINTTDPDQTFITGAEPDNYIWYSGKLWRAVSIDPSDNSVKIVTQWNISSLPYNSSGKSAFDGSHAEMWLNDTSSEGFLGTLREPESFIKMDSKWNATVTSGYEKPEETTLVEDAVGLLNVYEFTMSYSGTSARTGYLNNSLYSWLLTPVSSSQIRYLNNGTNSYASNPTFAYGIRPAVNLKNDVRVSAGDGTEDNPYRLEGDDDTDLAGTLLNTRYSGEYITFGTGENNLYRIVSHGRKSSSDNYNTKIVSAEPLKENGEFKLVELGDINYSSTTTLGSFLNEDFLNPSNGYLTSDQLNMIESDWVWYLGTVANGISYKLARYASINSTLPTTSTTATVGTLRIGELMAGQFERYATKGTATSTGLTTDYFTLTKMSTYTLRSISAAGGAASGKETATQGVKPSFNLNSSVIITGGDGTKENPFTIALS